MAFTSGQRSGFTANAGRDKTSPAMESNLLKFFRRIFLSLFFVSGHDISRYTGWQTVLSHINIKDKSVNVNYLA
jgi:hypothetical protein